MKTIVWTLVAAALLTAPAAAQRPGPRGPGRGEGGAGFGGPAMTRMVGIALERRDSLGLTDQQVRDLEAMRTDLERINTGLREEMDRLREETGDDRAQMRDRFQDFQERVRTAREEQRERFDAILTEQQRERLGEMVRRGPGVGRDRRGPEGRPGPGGPGRDGRRGPREGDLRRGSFGPGAIGPVGRVGMRSYREGFRDGLRAARRVGGRRVGRGPFGPL